MKQWNSSLVSGLQVVAASQAMTATLPGRTHGLGLIASPLMHELEIGEVAFGVMNFFASVLGALFAFPSGWMIDRFGARTSSVAILFGLAVSTGCMAFSNSAAPFFATLVLVRGFGQTALSVASMSIISKWFRDGLGLAMGAFAVLLTFGFIGSVLAVGALVEKHGWRDAWFGVSIAVFMTIPIIWLCVHKGTAQLDGIEPIDADTRSTSDIRVRRSRSFRIREILGPAAFRDPCFWALALGAAFFNLVWSSITLFNEAILSELGFTAADAVKLMAILTGIGLISNVVTGRLARRENIGKLMGVGLLVLAVALASFPYITSMTGLYFYGGAMGLVGGLITVVFFTGWRSLFGREQVGVIQGLAQAITVLFSALGPVVISLSQSWLGSHLPIFGYFAAASLALAVWAMLVRPPKMDP